MVIECGKGETVGSGGNENYRQRVGPRLGLWGPAVTCEVKIHRLKFRTGMTVVGLFGTYPAVKETIFLCFYIREVYKSIRFPFSSEGPSTERIKRVRIDGVT